VTTTVTRATRKIGSSFVLVVSFVLHVLLRAGSGSSDRSTRRPHSRLRFAGALFRHLLRDHAAQARCFLHHLIEPREGLGELAFRQFGFLDTRHDAANITPTRETVKLNKQSS
jgi:hypothetical protein